MVSVESALFQLKSEFVIETSIPNEYLNIVEITDAIKQYNWRLYSSHIFGWTNLVKSMRRSF
jgi:hypothetical protein